MIGVSSRVRQHDVSFVEYIFLIDLSPFNELFAIVTILANTVAYKAMSSPLVYKFLQALFQSTAAPCFLHACIAQ